MSEIALAVERFTALAFIITGLSHMMQPRAWAELFIRMRESGVSGGFLNAYMHGPTGMLIVAFHNLWSWPHMLVTLVGWSLTLKGALYFCYPQLAQRSMARVSVERAGEFRYAGAFALVLGATIGWVSLQP